MKKEEVQNPGLADSTRRKPDWSQSMFRQEKRRQLKSEQRNEILGCLSQWNSGRKFFNFVQNEAVK